jgi:acetyl esterase
VSRVSAGASSGVFRYGALVDALWSLRDTRFFERATPSEAAVRYRAASLRGIAPLADVYRPAREGTGASVVLVHGGGFVIGSRRMPPMRYLASRLVSAGIAVCAIDYRMIFRGGRLDEALADVRTAFSFWRERVAQSDLDPARVSLVGLSAGATLAMLTAASLEPGAVHRLACGFGLYELDHLHGPLAGVVPRLLFRTADRDRWSARSPRGSTQPSVPTLLLHGTADGLVPVEQSERLAAHRESLGLPTKLVVYTGAPHGFFNSRTFAGAGADEIIAHVG